MSCWPDRRRCARTSCIKTVLFAVVGWLGIFPVSAQQTNNAPSVDLKLADYLQQVLRYNQSIQAQMVEAQANSYKQRAELGIFEPLLDTSVTREANRRTNNLQELTEESGQPLYDERNNIYDGGIEQMIPLGGKIRLGATMSDLGNNINPYGTILEVTNNLWTRQYQTFIGATITQPLLKDFGMGPTLAAYRLAALDSDIAFQEYRRQLMLTMAQAEGAYWNLYYAQEQVHFFDDSVAAAQEVLSDSQEKLKAGQGAELDVMEAQSALALRKTKRNDAVQSYYDALGHLQTYAGVLPDPTLPASGSPQFRAVDDPHTTNSPPTYQDTYQEAFSLNPDYLIQQEKMNQERLRLGVAKNQLLPELDVKAAYGYNGLGGTPAEAWNAAESQSDPSWSAGLELTMPLGGNIKGRNELKAARLGLQEAYINLKGVETQMANSLSISIQKARAWQQSIQSYQTVVDYDQAVFQTQLARLRAGTVEAQAVLDAEADWLDSRQDLAGALAQYRNALLEIELNDGALLEKNGLEITRKELQQQTEAMLEQNQNYAVKNIPPPPDEFPPVPPPDKTVPPSNE